MRRVRVDQLLVERGLVESRALAQRLVMAGQVRAAGQVVPKSASLIPVDTELQIDAGPRYVSRGGEKLQAALEAFRPDVSGQICADVGASTGGFTDCLLQYGAARVYAIDVGRGVLHWKLRQDPRVRVMEGANARFLERLPEPVGLTTVDASFISLKVLLPVVRGWFGEEGGTVVALIKPQFEAGRSQAAHGSGVIRDAAVHRQVLLEVLGSAQSEGYGAAGLIRSPLLGPKGNIEFLACLVFPARPRRDLPGLVSEALHDED